MSTKHFSVVIVAVLAVLFSVSFARAEVIYGDWQFDEASSGSLESTADSSGYGHTGIGSGATLPTYAPGYGGSTGSLNVTDNDDRVVVAKSTDFDLRLDLLTDYTIEADICSSEWSSNVPHGPIFAKYYVAGQGNGVYGYAFRVTYSGSTNKAYLGFYLQGTYNGPGVPNYAISVTDNMDIVDGSWHHVKVVIDANEDPSLTKVSLYVDDAFRKSASNPDFVNEHYAIDTQVGIGGKNPEWTTDSGSYEFNGQIDNVKFTASAANPIPEPGTLALLACGLVGLLAYAWRKRR